MEKAVMVCIDTFKLQTMTALIKSFCGGGQMLHGGSFFKKRPPWSPHVNKKDLTFFFQLFTIGWELKDKTYR
jgi:hypothetical protein